MYYVHMCTLVSLSESSFWAMAWTRASLLRSEFTSGRGPLLKTTPSDVMAISGSPGVLDVLTTPAVDC